MNRIEDAFRQKFDDLAASSHVAQGLRDHIATQVAMVRSLAENANEPLDVFFKRYGELAERFNVLFRFALEHARQDTKSALDAAFVALVQALSPREDLNGSLARLEQVFTVLETQSHAFFQSIVTRYRLDLEKLRRNAEAICKNPELGMSFPLRALHKRFPKSRILKSYAADLADFERFLSAAEKSFAADFTGGFTQTWERFRNAARDYEIAKFFGKRISEPFTDAGFSIRHDLIDHEFESVLKPNNAVERLNLAYYWLRGREIYRDFFTKASGDPLLASGDAEAFYRRVKRLQADKQPLPDVLNIVECGIGDGKFAADFLDHIALLDLRAASQSQEGAQGDLIYPKLRYHLFDVSERMLQAAQDNPHLNKHARILAFRQLDAGAGVPQPEGGIFYARFQELFDDIPRAPLVYVDDRGKLWEMKTRLLLRQDAVIRAHDFGQADRGRFVQHLRSGEFDGFEVFHPDDLQAVDVECEMAPLDSRKIPHGAAMAAMLRDHRDILLPVSVGAAEFLDAVLEQLVRPHGMLSILDYGYKRPSDILHARHYFVSQQNRRYGGSLTNDISYPMLSLVARTKNFRTRIFLQEELIRLVSREPMLDTTPFIPEYSGRSFLRQVSVDQAMVGLRYLRGFDVLKRLAGRDKKPSANGFARFIAEAQEKDLIGRGASFTWRPGAKDHLENLGLELDFWLSGIFRCAVGRDAPHWLPLKHPFIVGSLEKMGFDAQRLFADLYENPMYGAFWVLQAE